MKKILFSIAMLVLTTAAFSQCFQILSGTRIQMETSGMYTLVINYQTDGIKSLGIVVMCGSTPYTSPAPPCFSSNSPLPNTQTYGPFYCPSGQISAILTPYTGSNCNSNSLCPPQIFYGPGFAPTPVKLGSFSAVRSKQVVSLNWNTEFEIDSKEFVVERAEGTEFRSVGNVYLNGNSSTKKSYSFNDKNENAGSTYYRLKNIDLNGKFTYSEIRTVKGIGAGSDITIFPNPARANSKVSVVGVTANSSIQLLDFSGKVLKNMNRNTVNSIDLSGVKNGSYLVRIIDKSTNEVVNKKLTVSN